MRRVANLFVSLALLASCGESSSAPPPSGESAPEAVPGVPAPSARVPPREQEIGLDRCADVIERIDSPDSTPSFARLMRECSGLYARRRCRDALAADVFSRDAIAEACRADYCEGLRSPPPFCRLDMPTDAEFLEHYARFSRMVLRRDLRRVMEQDGADEIADLFADLIEGQAARQQ